MKVVQRPIDDIAPYEKNPRQNDAAVEAVAASIREFGFRQPIVVDEAGVIICGHTRFKAAQQLGLAKVPVHVATDLNGHLREPEVLRSLEPGVAADDHPGLVDHDWLAETELLDRCGDGLDGSIVLTRVLLVGGDVTDGPLDDLHSRLPPCRGTRG